MQEWLQNQEWSSELSVAALFAAVVLVSVLHWGYENFFKR